MTTPPRSCRLCGETGVSPVLSLGNQPLANAYLTREQLAMEEPRFPLELGACESCRLVQILDGVPPERLFSEYLYFSSFSETMNRHAREIAERVIGERSLGPRSFVVEIASNDGYLLRHFVERGIPVLGIEPAANVAEVARLKHQVPTITEFFGIDLARRLRSEGRRADVILANNVLAHVPDLNGFVEGIRELLAEDGVAIVEVPYVCDMLDRCEFDTIYHEHLSYFSVTSLRRLVESHGLSLSSVERLPIHGGSLRLFITHGGDPGEDVLRMCREEEVWGVRRREPLDRFAERVKSLREELRALLRGLKSEGKRIAAYGAAAKGTVLLNYCSIGTETIDFVVDRSTYKQGRYVPGAHLEIRPPEHLLEALPDAVLVLVWNFIDEVLDQQAEYRRRGGRFIVPIPEPRIL